MPEAIIAAIGWALMGTSALVTVGAYMVAYASIIATTLIVVGGLAYSSSKASGARKDARNRYNAAQVDRLTNVSSTTAPRELVLGRVRKGGAVFYRASTGTNSQDLYIAIALAGHEIDAVQAIYVNDVLVELDSSGSVLESANHPYSKGARTTESGNTGTGTTLALPATYVAGTATGIYHVDGYGTEAVVTVSGLTATSDNAQTTISYQYTATASWLNIKTYLGGSGQAASPELLAAFPSDWVAANTVQGCAYLVAKLTYNETAYPSGVPNITALIRGAKLFDPRNNSTVWSENPALMMRHIYQHAKFGKASITAAEEARFVAAANACDTSTVYTIGGVAQTAQALYKAALALPFGAAAKDGLDDLAQAMGGSWAHAGGELYLKAGVYTASVMSLTDADLAVIVRDGASETQRPIGISVHRERAQKFNTVKVKIWDNAQSYKQTDLTPLVGAALVTRDGVELVQEVTFPAIGYAPQALHVAGIMMRDARDPLTVELPFKLRAYPLEIFDTVEVTLSRYGWTAKTFMILGRTWTADGALQLTIKETAASITQMDSGFSPQGFAANTKLPTPWIVAQVGPLTVVSGTAEAMTQADGTVVSRMRISWTQIADAAVRQNGQIEVQYRLSTSSGAWESLIVPGNETQAITTDAKDGFYYIVRARAKTSVAVSDWSLQVSHRVMGKTAAPPVPTATATGGMFQVVVGWTFGDAAVDVRGTEVWWSATNDRATAARLSFEPHPATAYSHIGLSAGQGGYYWLRVVNTSTVASAWFPASATAGLYALASANPSALLVQLNKSLGLDQLVSELAQPIGSLPGGLQANAIASLQNSISDWDLTNRMQFQENVTNATITVDPVTGQIQLLATAVVTTDVESRLSAAEVKLTADKAAIDLNTASIATTQGSLTTTQSTVSAHAGQLATSASTTYVDNSVNAGVGKISTEAANAALALSNAAIQEALNAFTQGQSLTAVTQNVATAQADIKTSADALASEVVSRSALVAVVAANGAAILAEQTVRANADSAEAASRAVLEARVTTAEGGTSTNTAAIATEQTARASGDSANASSISTLSAQVNHATTGLPQTRAELITEYTTRANADNANASSISAISAQVNHVTTGLPQTRAELATEYTTRANADSANANSINVLSAQVNHATTGLPQTRAELSTEYTTRANADSANVSSINVLSAQVNHVTTGLPQTRAELAAEYTTRANADSANASTSSTLVARLDTGDYAAVKTQSSTSASKVSGLEAQYTFKVDVNGRVAGLQLATGAGGASIVMLADKFLWVMETATPGVFTTPKNVLVLGNIDGVPTLGLSGDLIVDGTITTRTIVAENITVLRTAYTNGTLYVLTTSDTLLQSVSIPTTGGKVFLTFTCELERDLSTDNILINVYRNSTLLTGAVRAVPASETRGVAISFTDEPPSGTNVYYVYGALSAGVGRFYTYRRSLSALETKR